MQLSNIKRGWMPLTLAAGLITVAKTPVYADIDQFSKIVAVINRTDTAEYIQEVNNENDIILNDKISFRNHLTAWQSKTMFLSSIQRIIDLPDFKAIVAMGRNAVPFILEEIEAKPSNLVWALNLIFKKKITDTPNTTIEEACKLWVKALRS
ncbi:hypothetical protein JHU38_00740 [Prevotella sp. A2931]|uniref:Uncharacterized protein n=1 Tax=Prevotella illustrans TaxID=2800387 RepID=A0ABS3M2A0_9BACT|nr:MULTISPECIES: hypothetical protein [Prevotella]MBO1362321.1 hypothetical protein [Prevotella illustrans]PTL26432.1 hypothetical protein C3V39_04830 [Prevotella sp. oral taxon 820]